MVTDMTDGSTPESLLAAIAKATPVDGRVLR
jgi:hypothetical protein